MLQLLEGLFLPYVHVCRSFPPPPVTKHAASLPGAHNDGFYDHESPLLSSSTACRITGDPKVGLTSGCCAFTLTSQKQQKGVRTYVQALSRGPWKSESVCVCASGGSEVGKTLVDQEEDQEERFLSRSHPHKWWKKVKEKVGLTEGVRQGCEHLLCNWCSFLY